MNKTETAVLSCCLIFNSMFVAIGLMENIIPIVIINGVATLIIYGTMIKMSK